MSQSGLIKYFIGLLIFGGLFACSSEPMLCETFHANGRLKYRVPCEDGIYDGLYEEYNRSGDLWLTRLYVDGKVEDTVRYYYSRTGELLKTVPMTAGEKDGLAQEYYKSGKIKRQQTYIAGERVGEEKQFYEDGVTYERLITYVQNIKQGPFLRQDEAGNRVLEGAFVQGKPYGTWIYYTAAGERLAEIPHKEGLRSGTLKVYRPNGSLYLSASFRSGQLNGSVRYYRRDGSTVFEEIWKGGTNTDYDAATGLEKGYYEEEIVLYHPGERQYIVLNRDPRFHSGEALAPARFLSPNLLYYLHSPTEYAHLLPYESQGKSQNP